MNSKGKQVKVLRVPDTVMRLHNQMPFGNGEGDYV